MRANRRSRWQSAALSVVTVASTGLLVIGPASPAHADPVCQQGGVYVLWVRGSGQKLYDVEARKFHDHMFYALSAAGVGQHDWAELGNLDNSSGPGEPPDGSDEYPAVPVDNWHAINLVTGVYADSISKGANELIAHLNDRYAGDGPTGSGSCSNEALVLGGYSQGAHVIGDALERQGYGSLSQAARDHIGYVALYGDPTSNRLSSTCPLSAKPNAPCGQADNAGVLIGRGVIFPPAWAGSWCDQYDGICNRAASLPGSHTTTYRDWWIWQSAAEIVNTAWLKVAELNPGTTQGGSSGSSGGGGGSSPSISRQMFLRGDSAVFAKDSITNGGWTQESDPGSIQKIAVGGTTQLVLNACNAVYARDTLGADGWVQETPCGGANQIAVSSTGVQMLIDACAAVWAKTGIGYGGWTQEAGCGNANAIAVGGNTQMFIRGDAAVFAKTWIGDGGWVQQVGPGNAIAIAADNTGMQAFIRGDGAVFAKRSFGDGGWQQQVGPGNAIAIAAGSGVLMFLRGDGAVFAKTDISYDGGWLPQADPHTVTAIAMGNAGRMMIRSNTNAIYAKDNLVNGDWHLQVGDGNAAAIAVG